MEMNGTCSHSFDYMQWVRWSLLPACVIITMFCFLERRVNLWPTCCHGRPGVAFPVNLVDSYTDRWSFAFAFGSMATFVFRVGELTASFDTGHVDVMLQGVVLFFLYLSEALIVSLVIYPILLCLQSQRGLLRNSIGLLYSVPWLVFCIGNVVLSTVPCKQTNVDQLDPVVEILQVVVLYGSGTICFFALVIRFLVGLIKNMRNGFGMSIFKGFLEIPDAPTPDFKKTHFYHRVKYLLTPTVQQKMSENIVLYLFQKYIGTVPGFRFSRHNICTFILTAVVTVQAVLLWSGVNGRLLYFYSTFQLPTSVQKITITFWVSSVVALIFTLACTIDMQLRYRKHTLMLWRGDRSFCPKQKRSFSVMMVASLRYPAYHVAYSLWGFIVIQILMWIILSLIVLLWDNVSLYLLKRYWLAFFIALAFYYGQILVARLVFLQRALDQQEQSTFICFRKTSLGLDNRRVFHVAVYFLLFTNFILGLMSCFLRILKALVFGVLFIGRMDRLTLMRDWELWDRGYGAYISFLQLEVAHTHPVLVTFCHFLLQTVKTDQASLQQCSTSEFVSVVSLQIEGGREELGRNNEKRYSQRMRNKWLVALTLARNPMLASQRKRVLQEANSMRTGLSTNVDYPCNIYVQS